MCASKKLADLSDPVQPVIGVVLAGGRSQRMGRDKTTLTPRFLDGQTLQQWAIERLAATCEHWLVADGGRDSCPNSVADGEGQGPVAGLLGAAKHFPGHPLLALACDLPLVPISALKCLKIQAERYDWAVPISRQGPEPLCALYGPQALEALRRRAHLGQFSLRRLGQDAPDLRCLRLPIDQLRPSQAPSSIDSELMFTNMNRPEDVEKIEILAAGSDSLERFLRLDSTKR